MTRKDYVIIARAVASLDLNARDKRHVADCLARELHAENAGFKHAEFHKACGTLDNPTSEALADVKEWQRKRRK